MNIDFIIYWVDGSDDKWLQKMHHYKGTPYQKNENRYRDWSILPYWFRAVEQYAPWVHRIFFISDEQIPTWLNINHPKLKIIDHKDFIPHQYLPTFNSHTIELNIHHIKELSEHFVIFNDDTFINQPITPDYYFKGGLPCDTTLEHIFLGRGYDFIDEWGISIIDFCNTQVLNAHFNRKEVVKGNFKRWYGSHLELKYRLQAFSLHHRTEFAHFFTPHNEKAFLKSVYEECWEKEPKMLSQSCSTFRNNVSLSGYFMRYWQLASNKFEPVPFKGKLVLPIITNQLGDIEKALFSPQIKSLCLNDSTDCTHEEFITLRPIIHQLFDKKFPVKSSFEL